MTLCPRLHACICHVYTHSCKINRARMTLRIQPQSASSIVISFNWGISTETPTTQCHSCQIDPMAVESVWEEIF